MRVLISGANGFAGSWLIRRLLADGHEIIGASGPAAETILRPEEQRQVRWITLDLRDPDSVAAFAAHTADAVVHLAGLASVAASFRDPIQTWDVNTVGTVRLMEALMNRRRDPAGDPLVLVVSSAEVYGRFEPDWQVRPRRETDPVAPLSPYASSKAAAELVALEAWRRTGLRVVIARPFPHTGVGQPSRFVVPAFIERVRQAKRDRTRTVLTGNLEPIRDFLDVRDVADAYAALLEKGKPGEIYNVAGGSGLTLEDVLLTAAELMAWDVKPKRDPALARPADIPHLVGDPAKLHALTGWKARHLMDVIIERMLHAPAD